MRTRRDKLDDVFSKLVRERADWTCEVCGKYFPEGHRQGLHCSHFFSRRHLATRWHPHNAAAMCFACHQRLGGNPMEFNNWIKEYLDTGEESIDLFGDLAIVSKKIMKFTKTDRAEIYASMKDEESRLNILRKTGKTGYAMFKLAPLISRRLTGEMS